MEREKGIEDNFSKEEAAYGQEKEADGSRFYCLVLILVYDILVVFYVCCISFNVS